MDDITHEVNNLQASTMIVSFVAGEWAQVISKGCRGTCTSVQVRSTMHTSAPRYLTNVNFAY